MDKVWMKYGIEKGVTQGATLYMAIYGHKQA